MRMIQKYVKRQWGCKTGPRCRFFDLGDEHYGRIAKQS